MKFEDFRKNINNKFDEIIKEDREEASKHFGSTRNAYLHGWREALDYVVSEMNKIESEERYQIITTQDVLSEKYAFAVLKKIYELTQKSDYDEEKNPILKRDLRAVVKSSSTLDKLLAKLEEDEYITLTERIKGRKTIAIKMTEFGLSVTQSIVKMDSLDLHYAKSILLKTLENAAPCQISNYLPIASNWKTLQDVINALVKDGYLFKREKIDQRKRYEISLTPKGHTVAKQLQIIVKTEARMKAVSDAAFVSREMCARPNPKKN